MTVIVVLGVVLLVIGGLALVVPRRGPGTPGAVDRTGLEMGRAASQGARRVRDTGGY